MRKKLISAAIMGLSVTLGGIGATTASAAPGGILSGDAQFKIGSTNYTVNGLKETLKIAPFVDANGSTLIPVRALAEALGAMVGWNQDSQTVSLLKDGKNISIKVGANEINVGGANVTLDTAAVDIDGHVFLPFRAIGEALGAQVNWDAASQSISVSDTGFLKLVKTIDLPGKGGHGDVVAYDPDQKAVYVAQSPDNNVIVINSETQEIEKVIPNMNGVNGIAVGPKYIYAANGDANQLAIIEKGTWNVVATVDTGGKTPDAVYYDAKDNKVFVANDDTNNMSVISADAPFNLVTSFALSTEAAKDGPDLGVLDPDNNKLYQSVDNYIDVIDPTSNTIVNKIKTDLPDGKDSKDMIYDPASKLIWIGTTDKKVYTLDPATGKLTGIDVKSGMDQIAWDPASKKLFLGEKADGGNMEVIDMTEQKSIGAVKTEKGFHTLDVDTDKHIVYAYLNDSNKIALYQENMDLLK